MTTTIQISEDIRVGRQIEIDGSLCNVEAISFTPAIEEKSKLEQLIEVMSEELIEQETIGKRDDGSFYWRASGEPLE
ncbi:hypothetical protein [Vibrio quintilis]|uniref:Uncharacterized protein n=1 Tax=Vibrio quintilis TaxID=1117707 RepID=A0A1M7YP24_9VIBR|nr:hypothetical protein [Vibrio quintilis]SHO54367.1 hypothetical protein VQ7734_00081 [Vibrio quintilis]